MKFKFKYKSLSLSLSLNIKVLFTPGDLMLPDGRLYANSKGCSGHTCLHSTKVGFIVGNPVGKYF